MRVAEPPKQDRPTDSGHGIAENQSDRPTEFPACGATKGRLTGG